MYRYYFQHFSHKPLPVYYNDAINPGNLPKIADSTSQMQYLVLEKCKHTFYNITRTDVCTMAGMRLGRKAGVHMSAEMEQTTKEKYKCELLKMIDAIEDDSEFQYLLLFIKTRLRNKKS